MTRVTVQPEMLRWACERAGYDVNDLAPRFPSLPAWERGEKQPTFKQLEAFAKATHMPFGFLFLPEPPAEPLPIPDFRTLEGRPARPSPELLDTIYAMQRRHLPGVRPLYEVQSAMSPTPMFLLAFIGETRPAAAGRGQIDIWPST